jgi:hypothetical protein
VEGKFITRLFLCPDRVGQSSNMGSHRTLLLNTAIWLVQRHGEVSDLPSRYGQAYSWLYAFSSPSVVLVSPDSYKFLADDARLRTLMAHQSCTPACRGAIWTLQAQQSSPLAPPHSAQ